MKTKNKVQFVKGNMIDLIPIAKKIKEDEKQLKFWKEELDKLQGDRE